MVSADNLNLDVLEQIFSYLPRGPNLAAVALVSRSFLAAVVPQLYAKISFRLRQAKRYPEIMSPFGAIMAHSELAIYVRSVEILSVPFVEKTFKLTFHSGFLRECVAALKLCRNLTSFKCTVSGVMPYFFPSINDKLRLERLCLYANLSSEQAGSLLTLPSVISLELQSGSWTVADILPKWVQHGLHRSLRYLTLYMIYELNEDVLEEALVQLPELRGLHVVGCPKIDHNRTLRAARHNTLLECLSLSSSESNKLASLPPANFTNLRALAVDARSSSSEAQEIPSAIFTYLHTSYFPLASFKIKYMQKNAVLSHDLVKHLTESHGYGLQRLSFLDCEVPSKSLEHIFKRCPSLERLDVPLSMKELDTFAELLTHAKNLRVLVVVDHHAQHGRRAHLTYENIDLFMSSAPQLRTVIDANRIWARKSTANKTFSVSLERRPTRKAGTHWFMPQLE